ncbi:WD40/YVTN/BNR-like repeat-containing protein [Oceanobacter mangrovi]|uniref:WD40/YVTN/BNR-like repeat-containing protein n=1 Tax=Oceanobacter mangrovi TaxID=2862510 RepID=UPI001C8E4360|nr:YCF48-related protein [Oceanobacter mangrovi]
MSVIKATLLCLALASGVSTVRAEWVDPLQSAAVPSQKAQTALMLDIAETSAGRLVAVGAYGNIIYSDDQGNRWQQAAVPVRVTLTSVMFADASHGWATGHDGVILASTDGGQSWQLQFDGHAANKAMIEASQSLLEQAEELQAEVADGDDDMAIEDADAAVENATFALEDAQYDAEIGSTKPLLDVLFVDAANGYAVGAYGMAFETHDGGNSWTEFSSRLPLSERPHLNAIAITASGQLYIVGEMGLLLSSDDAGESWQSLESPYEGSLFGILGYGNKLLLMGLRGHLYNSQDDGASWQELALDNEDTLIGATLDDGNPVLVGNGGTLVKPLLSEPEIDTVAGRKNLAAVIAVSNGYVLAGEAGIQLVNKAAQLLPPATMSGGTITAEASSLAADTGSQEK